MDYFPHPVTLSSDHEIEMLESVHKNTGYAVYLKLVERILREGDELPLSNPMSLSTMSIKLNLEGPDNLREIIKTCVEAGLFDQEPWESKQVLTSHWIREQFSHVEDWRARNRKKKPSRVFTGENPDGIAERKVEDSERKEKDISRYSFSPSTSSNGAAEAQKGVHHDEAARTGGFRQVPRKQSITDRNFQRIREDESGA